MRLGQMVAAMLGIGAIYAEPTRRSASDMDSIIWSAPSQPSNKPNRISQAKRRKYKRQGRV